MAGDASANERDVAVAHRQVRAGSQPPGVLHISNVALADDASFVVYTGSTDKDTSLFVHRFDDGSVQPVRGTSGARWPFLSPDGKWVGSSEPAGYRKFHSLEAMP